MKNKQLSKLLPLTAGILALGLILTAGYRAISSNELPAAPGGEPQQSSSPERKPLTKPKYVRGIHLTAWVAGSPKLRSNIDRLLDETELNSVVIAIKEYEGEVYIPGVKKVDEYKTFVRAIPDIESYLADLKKRGVYTIARIVVFKDNKVPRKNPSLGVKNPDGTLWADRKNIVWLDPYNKGAWDYNLDIAERAVELGFDEIQFDYIRFPSDGNVKTCTYSVKHSSINSSAALVGFLEAAHKRLKPLGVNLSIDVFGLTTTVSHDMGIGQRIGEMAKWVDYVSPMVYPSHYARGEYGIADPNRSPYRTVYLGMAGAKKRFGENAGKLRPYLQDFSLGHHYGPREVLDQIQATYDNDMGEWLLWNPRCVYTEGALRGKEFADVYEKKSVRPAEKEPVTVKNVKVSTGAPAAAPVIGKEIPSAAEPAQPEKKTPEQPAAAGVEAPVPQPAPVEEPVTLEERK